MHGFLPWPLVAFFFRLFRIFSEDGMAIQPSHGDPGRVILSRNEIVWLPAAVFVRPSRHGGIWENGYISIASRSTMLL